MGKQNKSKKPESLGKGKVTPMQIAFIVDRYLSDNNFSETRSVFRTEAASLIAKSPVQEAPKSLLSLGAMLNEYICLKEQKVILDQEKFRLDQEKFRVQALLQGMQEVMNAYNASASAPPPMIQASATQPLAVVPAPDPPGGSSAGYPVYKSPAIMPVSLPSKTIMEQGNMSSPITSCNLTRKRVISNAPVEAIPAAKKSCNKLPSRKITIKDKQSNDAVATQKMAQPSTVIGSSPHNHTPSIPLAQGSSVAKSLFNRPWLSPPASSSGPKTPPQVPKSLSPSGVSSLAHCSSNSSNNTPQEITPTNCTIITSERVMVSPCKHVTYTVERKHCISSPPVKTTLKRLSKRDNVKGRLDFDGSDAAVILDKPDVEDISTPKSDKELEIFDMDLPSLDAFGANFSFSELLVDLDLGFEGIGCPCEPDLGPPADTISGSSYESKDCNLGTDQVISELSSTMTEMISERDLHMKGPDSLTAARSVTKCIRILSPVKNQRSSSEGENC